MVWNRYTAIWPIFTFVWKIVVESTRKVHTYIHPFHLSMHSTLCFLNKSENLSTTSLYGNHIIWWVLVGQVVVQYRRVKLYLTLTRFWPPPTRLWNTLTMPFCLIRQKGMQKNYVWMFSMLAFLAGHSKVVTKRRIEATAAERLKNWQNGQIHCPFLPDTSSLPW